MADANQPAETELLATMMLEGTVTVPDDDMHTSPTTETVQPEGDTVCPGQAEGSLGKDNLASSITLQNVSLMLFLHNGWDKVREFRLSSAGCE